MAGFEVTGDTNPQEDAMKWWKKALIATIVLFVLVAVFAVASHEKNIKSSADSEFQTAQDDKLGTLCGEMVGAGAVIIWVVAYRTKKKQ